jgi:hypothetical protein
MYTFQRTIQIIGKSKARRGKRLGENASDILTADLSGRGVFIVFGVGTFLV